VLILNSNDCFHYGSRNSIDPRYMMMYGYTSPCRTDLSETTHSGHRYPIRDDDPTLRKMVLSA